ncbi:hypothetical protein AB1Y20_006330 [Prymnesium parvum]|uniref:Guanylate-binding protein N-terminal domain-containing protein n=1 Tax=Prymnesium parvum TaxID=97485 RepID=A0AB34J4G4_PRYPA
MLWLAPLAAAREVAAPSAPLAAQLVRGWPPTHEATGPPGAGARQLREPALREGAEARPLEARPLEARPLEAMALLLPDASGNKLELQPPALAWLESLRGPLAVVSAIGQYRSGKSYLLNQMMGLPCDKGFTVGHERHTQTKGVWFMEGGDAGPTRTLYFDTEGFDATGKAAVYDDRIFAFSTLISSAMLYNLVETIKEADVEKLSFVAQLAQEFWRRSQGAAAKGRGAHRTAKGSEWMPPALLWLVQRDFLQGSTVDEYLRDALKVASERPTDDEHAKRLNQIRKALSAFGDGMSGMGLVQPHVRRTALCELEQKDLAPEYIAGLARVREWVSKHTAADAAGGRVWPSGAELVAQVRKLVEALNAQEIPTAGSVIDAFNRDLILRNTAELKATLHAIALPLPTHELDAQARAAVHAAKAQIIRQTFGADLESAGGLGQFDASVDDLLHTLADANFRASHAACNGQWERCSGAVEKLKSATLPSRRRFWARIQECNITLASCVGPAAPEYLGRLHSLAVNGAAEYGEAFLNRISHLMLVGCAGGILVFRYVLQHATAEFVCWVVLIAVEVLPRLNAITQFSNAPTFWDSPTGQTVLQMYESAVYNEYIDADDWIHILLLVLVAVFFVRQCRVWYNGCCETCCGGGRRRKARAKDASRRGRKTRPVDYDDEEDEDEDDEERELRRPSRTLRR